MSRTAFNAMGATTETDGPSSSLVVSALTTKPTTTLELAAGEDLRWKVGHARAIARAAGSTAVSAASTASTAVFTSPSPASTNPPLIAIECVSEYSRLAESGNATNTSRPTLPARSMYVAVELPSTLGLMSSAMAAVAGDAKTGASAGTAVSTAHAEPSFSAAAGATTTMVSALSTEAENSSADAANVTRAIEAAGMSAG